jgi:hypothetical protein
VLDNVIDAGTYANKFTKNGATNQTSVYIPNDVVTNGPFGEMEAKDPIIKSHSVNIDSVS